MKDTLPPHFLKEKLPRFLQKCAQKFESDQRYRNDLRYLRVWLQLVTYLIPTSPLFVFSFFWVVQLLLDSLSVVWLLPI